MRFENRFDVDTPIEKVWDAVLDVERVAPAVPGAQVLEQSGEDAYKVAIKVKVGPMSMTYQGEVEITDRDDAAHRAVMKARAKESRGQGTANADVVMELSGDEARTTAVVTTDVALTGKVASMGRGVLQDVSGRLVETFAENLAAMLGESGEGAAGAVPPASAEPAAASPAAPASPSASAEPPAASPSPPAPAEPSASTAAAREAAASASPSAPPPASPPAAREAAAPVSPSSQWARPADEEALDLGSIGGAVIADKVGDPRRLAGLIAAALVVLFLLRRRSRR